MSDELDIDYTTAAVLPDDDAEAERRVEWHARMVRHYAAQLEQEKAAYGREIDRLREEIALRERAVNTRINWHTDPIESYHRMRQRQDPAYKTLRLPHATSKISVPTTPVIQLNDGCDPDAVPIYRWLAEHHPEVLLVPGIAAIRKLLTVVEDEEGNFHVADKSTGERIPYYKAVVPEPRYTLTPAEGAPL
jgi:hypothetical protein